MSISAPKILPGGRLNRFELFTAIKSEGFSERVAFMAASFYILTVTTDHPKALTTQSVARWKRKLEKKLQDAFEPDLRAGDPRVQADFELALQLWKVTHNWDVQRFMPGIGGASPKTFHQLLKEKSLPVPQNYLANGN